jgi:hypothetical protein
MISPPAPVKSFSTTSKLSPRMPSKKDSFAITIVTAPRYTPLTVGLRLFR